MTGTNNRGKTVPPSTYRSRAAFWLVYAGVWIPFAIVYAALLAAERQGRFSDALVAAALSVSVAALLGVAVWLLTGALEPLRRRWVVGAVHLGGAVAYAIIWIAAIWLRIAWQSSPEVAAAYLRSPATGWQVLSGMWLYGVLAGVFHTVRARERAEDHERALEAAELRRAHSEASRVTAELRAIRARLDPHFFFNTLQTLLPLVKSAPAEAAGALEKFGRMMRYVLDEDLDGGTTTLGGELRFVRDYLALESLRLGARLHVRERIDGSVLDTPLPKLTLQPLVENAIVHGIAPRAAGGAVELSVERIAETVVIRITDDGPGTTPAAFEGSRGLGIAAVRERLAFAFEGRASFVVTTAPDAGFSVRIEVPDDEEPFSSLAVRHRSHRAIPAPTVAVR